MNKKQWVSFPPFSFPLIPIIKEAVFLLCLASLANILAAHTTEACTPRAYAPQQE